MIQHETESTFQTAAVWENLYVILKEISSKDRLIFILIHSSQSTLHNEEPHTRKRAASYTTYQKASPNKKQIFTSCKVKFLNQFLSFTQI